MYLINIHFTVLLTMICFYFFFLYNFAIRRSRTKDFSGFYNTFGESLWYNNGNYVSLKKIIITTDYYERYTMTSKFRFL